MRMLIGAERRRWGRAHTPQGSTARRSTVQHRMPGPPCIQHTPAPPALHRPPRPALPTRRPVPPLRPQFTFYLANCEACLMYYIARQVHACVRVCAPHTNSCLGHSRPGLGWEQGACPGAALCLRLRLVAHLPMDVFDDPLLRDSLRVHQAVLSYRFFLSPRSRHRQSHFTSTTWVEALGADWFAGEGGA